MKQKILDPEPYSSIALTLDRGLNSTYIHIGTVLGSASRASTRPGLTISQSHTFSYRRTSPIPVDRSPTLNQEQEEQWSEHLPTLVQILYLHVHTNLSLSLNLLVTDDGMTIYQKRRFARQRSPSQDHRLRFICLPLALAIALAYGLAMPGTLRRDQDRYIPL